MQISVHIYIFFSFYFWFLCYYMKDNCNEQVIFLIFSLQRYNIGSDGVITMSLILSIGRSAFDPVRCISTIDYNYAKNDDLYNVIRMVFTPFQDST